MVCSILDGHGAKVGLGIGIRDLPGTGPKEQGNT